MILTFHLMNLSGMTYSTKTPQLGGNKLPLNPRWTEAQQVLQANRRALSHGASGSQTHTGCRGPDSEITHLGTSQE